MRLSKGKIGKQNKQNILPIVNKTSIQKAIKITPRYQTKREETQIKFNQIQQHPHYNSNNLEFEESEEISFGLHKNNQKDKLLELTAKCVDYYKYFALEKDTQLQILSKVFSDIKLKVNEAFKNILDEVSKKNQQILSFLQKKYLQLIQQKQKHEQALKNHLDQIQSIHLIKFLQNQKCCTNQTLTSYANTLNNYFNIVFDIEKNNYQDNVQECVSFINNLIIEQIKNILYQKIPQKLEELINVSFGNDQFLLKENQQMRENLLSEQSFSLPISKNVKDKLVQQINEISKQQQIKQVQMANYINIINNLSQSRN